MINRPTVAEKRAELGLGELLLAELSNFLGLIAGGCSENRKNARYTKEDDDQLRAAGDAAGGAVDWNAVGLRLSFPRTGKACYTRYHSIKSASPNSAFRSLFTSTVQSCKSDEPTSRCLRSFRTSVDTSRPRANSGVDAREPIPYSLCH